MAFVSIIVPVFNGEKFLRGCLESIRAQTFADWEAVCVDDGSTDASGAILDEMAAADPRIKVLRQPNRGVSAARNAALEATSGEWFGFVDCDDTIAPDALSDILSFARRCGADAVQLNGVMTAPDGCATPLVPLSDNAAPLDLLVGRFAGTAYPFARFYSRSRFGHLRFPDGMQLREDLIFWLDALAVPGAHWAVAEKRFYRYNRTEASASNNASNRGLLDLLECPTMSVKRLREGLGASDAQVEEFLRRQADVSGGLMSGLFLRWLRLTAAERDTARRLADELAATLGRNPLSLAERAILAIGCVVPFAVPPIFGVVRAFRKAAKLLGRHGR